MQRRSTHDQWRAAKGLLSVVSTMKTLASVRSHRYRHAVQALEQSSRTMDLAWQVTLRAHPELLTDWHPRDGEALDAHLVVVVFGPSRGLCGPFAERVVRHAVGLLEARAPSRDAVHLAAVGGRVARRLQAAGWPVRETLPPPGSLVAVEDAAADLVMQFDAWLEGADVPTLVLVYMRPTTGIDAEAYALQLLPLDVSWLRAVAQRTWPSRRIPMTVGDDAALLRGVIRQSLSLAVVRAFAASLAAENAARLTAMRSAERRVEERIDDLARRARRERQARVMEEILDVQAGFRVVAGGRGERGS